MLKKLSGLADLAREPFCPITLDPCMVLWGRSQDGPKFATSEPPGVDEINAPVRILAGLHATPISPRAGGRAKSNFRKCERYPYANLTSCEVLVTISGNIFRRTKMSSLGADFQLPVPSLSPSDEFGQTKQYIHANQIQFESKTLQVKPNDHPLDFGIQIASMPKSKAVPPDSFSDDPYWVPRGRVRSEQAVEIFHRISLHSRRLLHQDLHPPWELKWVHVEHHNEDFPAEKEQPPRCYFFVQVDVEGDRGPR